MGSKEKLYAAYKTGFLGEDILNTYFSFLANIILDNNVYLIDEHEIVDLFEKRYELKLPVPFVKQVLGVGVKNGAIINDHGKYIVSTPELSEYRFNTDEFEKNWAELIKQYEKYCLDNKIKFPAQGTEAFILEMIDCSDDSILAGDKLESDFGMNPNEYAWYSFIKKCSQESPILFEFIAAICASNITKQALFYAGEAMEDYSRLNVYLDSPMIFALLGMDISERTAAYKMLVQDMQQAGCHLHVLDHNFQEVEGIIERAAVWAQSNQYDIRKASNAARFFHDNQMNSQDITEFCGNVEAELNKLGITIKTTDYDIYQNDFQENERELFDMVKSKYEEQQLSITEKEDSIRIDVRSIIMIYRERRGQTATRINAAGHLMLTTNNAIANVSKKFESNRSINAGHIPACISADLFGAVLWLSSPMELGKYQQKRLLADCYGFLQPDRELLDRYIKSLEEARNADEIDDKKFLLLKSHPVVRETLMNITHGDYARFSSTTYIEVYDEIVAQSKREYEEEAALHEKTKSDLGLAKKANEELHGKIEILKQEKKDNEEQLAGKISELENQLSAIRELVVLVVGWLSTFLFVGIPYICLIALLELLKTNYTDITINSFVCVIGLLILGAIAVVIFQKGKQYCFKKVREIVYKDNN